MKIWNESDIVTLLNTRRDVFEAAIVTLFVKGQTADEQVSDTTRHENKVGFSAADAKRMSFLAKFLQSGGHLRTETIQKYMPRVVKYRKQLVSLANEKEARKAASRATLAS
jgi:hypothetical protein